MAPETSYKPFRRAFAMFAVALLAVCALGGIATFSEDSEGASGSFDMGTAYKGQYFSNSKTQVIWDFGENMVPQGISVSGSTTQNGLTVSVSQEDADSYAPEVTVSVSGTPTQTGTISWSGKSNYFCTNGDEYVEETFTVSVTVTEASTPVTSVSISGSSSVDVGNSITLRASVYPSSATDRSVTWSIDSGSSYVSIDDNGTSCTVTGVRAGTATIRCEANDGSGEYDTLRITVSSPSYNYNLKFNANGGSGAPNTITKTATDKTSNLKFTIPSTEPTRSGYTFLGWSESSSASSATYTAGDTVYVDYNDLTLYAVWQENKQTYYAKLYYNANGGSGAPSTQSDSIYASSASGSKSFTISTTKPTRSGYDFLGWSTSSSASSASYQPGGSISVSYGSSKTLYAVWKQAEYTSTLIFDANGGSGAPSKLTDTHTSTSAHTFTIPSTKPTKSGYIFLGWSDSKTASAASYQPGGSISVPYNGSKTLYAVWEQAKITITSNPALTSLKVGQAWSYTPAASVDGCAVSVSGADWLSASNGKVSGTPTKAGTYTVTITLEKDGYESATQTFTLKVYSALGFDSEPSSKGILTYVSG